MLFLQDDFERVKKNKDREPWKPIYDGLIEKCERLVTQPFPETDRALHNWTLERARVLLDVCVTLGACYKLTDDIRFARKAAEFLLDSINWDLWYYKTEVSDCSPYDLGTAETAMAFAVTLPMLGGAMSAAERNSCLEALNKRVLSVYLDNTTPDNMQIWWHRGTNNWNCVCNGGQLAISTYMASLGFEAKRAEEAIGRALNGLQAYFDSMHEDGSCEEGIAYWGYATKYFIMALLYWENATGKKHPFFSVEKCKKWLRFPFELTFGNAALGFGDCNFAFSCDMAYAYAARIGDAEIMSETAARLNENEKDSIWSLMFTRGVLPQRREVFTEGKIIWYPNNGWAILSRDDFALSFRSGTTNVSHAQKDLQSIQLSRGGVALLENMGNHPYPVGWFGPTRSMYWEDNTASKNAPLFNGIGQDKLAAAIYEMKGDRVVSEGAAAYPDFVSRVLRSVGFASGEDGGVFRVEDELESRQEMYHELRFVTRGDFERLSDNEVLVTRDGQEAPLRLSCGEAFDIRIGTAHFSVPIHPAASILRVYTLEPVLASEWTIIIG